MDVVWVQTVDVDYGCSIDACYVWSEDIGYGCKSKINQKQSCYFC